MAPRPQIAFPDDGGVKKLACVRSPIPKTWPPPGTGSGLPGWPGTPPGASAIVSMLRWMTFQLFVDGEPYKGDMRRRVESPLAAPESPSSSTGKAKKLSGVACEAESDSSARRFEVCKTTVAASRDNAQTPSLQVRPGKKGKCALIPLISNFNRIHFVRKWHPVK